ncbi:MAG: DMT family transporter [Prevotellaceae bacterium]|nr:DMT family transporter [Prevotellaceae bacterium]MDY3365067.1 DMT family transporter [Prevotella sp.]
MQLSTALLAHLSMFFACAFWGLMAPLGKDAMSHGIDGMAMVSFRVAGAMILFWTTSLFFKQERVPLKDILLLGCAGVFGLVCNQCCFTIGLSLTSPVNASIVTTGMPIFAMILSAIILKEPLTGKKALGVLMGCSGALILILTSVAAANNRVGDIRGDLLCLTAQFSYALYLSLFNKLVKRYSVITVNRWMFLWATLLILPFSYTHILSIPWADVPIKAWFETGYVVVVCTFVCYLLIMFAQKILRPTVVSIYNYVQPLVSVIVSLLLGLASLQWTHALAVALVFSGVWLVVKSKSKNDIEKAKQS